LNLWKLKYICIQDVYEANVHGNDSLDVKANP